MKQSDAVEALAALAQEHRLEIFRLLVQAGQEGVTAGQVAELMKLAPNNLTFHFDRLRHAGLISVRRDGRSMIYTARYESMTELLAYLTENCCADVSCKQPPSKSRRAVRQHSEQGT